MLVSIENLFLMKPISEGTPKSQIGKNRFNNGFTNAFKFECPKEFKPGRIYKRKICIKNNLE